VVFVRTGKELKSMAKSTSITLGDHFEGFISQQISNGRYGSASEIVREGLRLVEEREQKFEAVRQALIKGEESGDAGPLDMEEIKRRGRKRARLAGLNV
jgi:antitoxin ParD1/3/4